MMTTFKQKQKKEMTEASASVCLLLATALQLVFEDVGHLTEQLIFFIVKFTVLVTLVKQLSSFSLLS